MAVKTVANWLTEWGTIFEDTSNIRFTADLFYEAWNQAQDYIVLKTPIEWLKECEVNGNTALTVATDTVAVWLPDTDSQLIRITAVELQTNSATVTGAHVNCHELPEQGKYATDNSYYTSTATYPLYVKQGLVGTSPATAAYVKFLHTIPYVASNPSLVRFFGIKKPIDIAAGGTITLPLALCRPCFRMAVMYGRYVDEQITNETMLGNWDTEIKLIGVKQGKES